MLNIETLQAGRIYSFRHTTNIETVGFRRGDNGRDYAPEWLASVSITRNAAFKGNLACPESYERKMKKLNPDWTPSGKEIWFEWADRNGIVVHKQTGRAYLALLNPEVISQQYFVNGVIATPDETATIKEWKKGSRSEEKPVFQVFNLDDSVEYIGEIPIGDIDPDED